MTYRYEQKGGLLFLVLAIVPVVYLLTMAQGWEEVALLTALDVLLVVLLFLKYFVKKGLRLDDEALIVERRLLSDRTYRLETIEIVYHPREKRLKAGLEIRRRGKEIELLDFVTLDNLQGVEQLRAALSSKLGDRYRDGTRDL